MKTVTEIFLSNHEKLKKKKEKVGDSGRLLWKKVRYVKKIEIERERERERERGKKKKKKEKMRKEWGKFSSLSVIQVPIQYCISFQQENFSIKINNLKFIIPKN